VPPSFDSISSARAAPEGVGAVVGPDRQHDPGSGVCPWNLDGFRTCTPEWILRTYVLASLDRLLGPYHDADGGDG
jgi:hypothetical protein